MLFTGALEDGWYIDFIRVETTSDNRLIVHDLYLDFLIPPLTWRYEVLDLDELADALTSGTIDAATCATVLQNAQQFVNRHLRNLEVGSPQSWPDFPPDAITELSTLPPFQSG